MTQNEINEVRERRLAATIEMAMKAYDVDEYGLAELIGMKRSTWTRYKRLPWGKKGCSLFFGLAQLLKMSPSWFFAEELETVDA